MVPFLSVARPCLVGPEAVLAGEKRGAAAFGARPTFSRAEVLSPALQYKDSHAQRARPNRFLVLKVCILTFRTLLLRSEAPFWRGNLAPHYGIGSPHLERQGGAAAPHCGTK